MSEILEMVQAGTSEIAEVQAKIDELDQRVPEAQLELEMIQSARADRERQRIEALALRTAASEKHTEAVGYAGLVRKKPSQKQAIQDVAAAKKALDQAQANLEQVEQETRALDQESAARESELQKQLHLWQFERETHHGEIRAMSAGLHKARAQLGTEKLTAFMQAYQDEQRKVDTRLAELVEAQAALYTLYQGGIDDLAAWPDLQRQIARIEPWQDSTTRVLEATLQHVQTLQQDTTDLNLDVPLPWRLIDILFIHESIMRSPGELGVLAQRLQQTLDAYRSYMERDLQA